MEEGGAMKGGSDFVLADRLSLESVRAASWLGILIATERTERALSFQQSHQATKVPPVRPRNNLP